MARWGKVDYRQLQKLQKQLDKLQDGDTEEFVKACAKELAARLLAEVIKETPTGIYDGEVEFDVDMPAKLVEFDTKSGKHVKFTTRPKKKHVKFTPKNGKVGGTLKRGWTSRTHEAAASGSSKPSAQDGKAYADSLTITREGNTYIIEITNPVEYASYVELGHRTADHKGWVTGRFMLTKSEQKIQAMAPRVLEKKLQKFLGECFK